MAPLCKGSCRAKGETEGLFFRCNFTFITAGASPRPTPHPPRAQRPRSPFPKGKANNVPRLVGRGGACSSRTKTILHHTRTASQKKNAFRRSFYFCYSASVVSGSVVSGAVVSGAGVSSGGRVPVCIVTVTINPFILSPLTV